MTGNAKGARMSMLVKQNTAPTHAHGRTSTDNACEARANALRKMGLNPDQHRNPAADVNTEQSREG